MVSCSRPTKVVQGFLGQFKVGVQKQNRAAIYDFVSSCRCVWVWLPWEGHPQPPSTWFCKASAPLSGFHGGYWGETLVCKICPGGMPKHYYMTRYTYLSWVVCLCEISFLYSLYYWLSFLVFIYIAGWKFLLEEKLKEH